MKRSSPPTRRTRLARGAPPRRSPKPINRPRWASGASADEVILDSPKRGLKRGGKSRFPKRRCQPYLDWLKEQPCCITKRRTGERGDLLDGMNLGEYEFPIWRRACIEATHVKARGAGGDDLYNAVPLDARLHRYQHQHGMKTFQDTYSVDLQALAREYTERFLALHPEFGDASP